MNRRYTLIVLLIFVALGILAYLQRDAEPIDFTDGGPTPTAAPILEVEGADVQEVDVANESQSYTLLRVAGGWEIDEEPLSDFVDGTIGRISSPTVLRSLPEDVDPDDFGFDSPSMTLTLKTAGGESHTMVVGDKHPLAPQYYLRLDGEDRIVIVSSDDLESLSFWFDSPPFVPTPTPEVSESEEDEEASDAEDAEADAEDSEAADAVDDGTDLDPDVSDEDAEDADAEGDEGSDADDSEEGDDEAGDDEASPTPSPTAETDEG